MFEQIITLWPNVRQLYRLLTAATLWLSSGPSAPLILIKFAICNFLFGPFLFHYCKSDIFICKFNEKCSDSLKQGFFQNILWCCYCQILKLWCKITVRELRILYSTAIFWEFNMYHHNFPKYLVFFNWPPRLKNS